MSSEISVATRLRHDENANDDFFSNLRACLEVTNFSNLSALAKSPATTLNQSISIRLLRYDTIRYDTRCYFNVRSKADMSQLNLPHGTDN